jgi:hypothetical protein
MSTATLNVLTIKPARARANDKVAAVLPINAAVALFSGPVAGAGIDSVAWSHEFVDLGGVSALYDVRASTLTVIGTAAAVEYARLSATR